MVEMADTRGYRGRGLAAAGGLVCRSRTRHLGGGAGTKAPRRRRALQQGGAREPRARDALQSILRRRVLRPAYGQAVAERPARVLATGRRSFRVRFRACRWTTGLHRLSTGRGARLQAASAPDRRVRLAYRDAEVGADVDARRLQHRALREERYGLLGGLRPQPQRARRLRPPAGRTGRRALKR